jgi:hypothetical protein
MMAQVAESLITAEISSSLIVLMYILFSHLLILFCTVFPKIHLRRNVYVSSEKEEE